jgi:hypothetical protein
MATCDSLPDSTVANQRIELRFLPRSAGRRGLAFPCNATGHVEIDRLTENQRVDYFFARALRGREFSCAIVAGNAG